MNYRSHALAIKGIAQEMKLAVESIAHESGAPLADTSPHNIRLTAAYLKGMAEVIAREVELLNQVTDDMHALAVLDETTRAPISRIDAIVLYPGGDREHKWSVDTLDEIARLING